MPEDTAAPDSLHDSNEVSGDFTQTINQVSSKIANTAWNGDCAADICWMKPSSTTVEK